LLQVEERQLTMVATDGHRLAYAGAKLPQPMERSEVIIPRKAVLELAKLLADSEDEVEIRILSNQVQFLSTSASTLPTYSMCWAISTPRT
jgi:DNA polymerase III subunit beta